MLPWEHWVAILRLSYFVLWNYPVGYGVCYVLEWNVGVEWSGLNFLAAQSVF